VPFRLWSDRIPLIDRLTQAHTWHTKRRRKTNLPGVPEKLPLIVQISGRSERLWWDLVVRRAWIPSSALLQ
jgi:hypothetical protein